MVHILGIVSLVGIVARVGIVGTVGIGGRVGLFGIVGIGIETFGILCVSHDPSRIANAKKVLRFWSRCASRPRNPEGSDRVIRTE